MKNSDKKDTANENKIEKNLEQLDYPASEDIYNKEEKVKNINPDNITNEKTIDQTEEDQNKNNLNIDKEKQLGDDLDVPGSELDDDQEEIGSEDEENNFYSEGDTN